MRLRIETGTHYVPTAHGTELQAVHAALAGERLLYHSRDRELVAAFEAGWEARRRFERRALGLDFTEGREGSPSPRRRGPTGNDKRLR